MGLSSRNSNQNDERKVNKGDPTYMFLGRTRTLPEIRLKSLVSYFDDDDDNADVNDGGGGGSDSGGDWCGGDGGGCWWWWW